MRNQLAKVIRMSAKLPKSHVTYLSSEILLLTVFNESLLLLVSGVLPDQAGGPDQPAKQLSGGEGLGAGGAIHLYTELVYCTHSLDICTQNQFTVFMYTRVHRTGLLYTLTVQSRVAKLSA